MKMKGITLSTFILLAFAHTSYSQAVGTCTTGDRFLPDRKNCDNYYVCIDGTRELMKCDTGLQFDHRRRACVDKTISQCYNELLRTEESVPTCPEGNVLLPNPIDCGSYYQCDHGTPILRPCPPGLNFNAEIGVCVSPGQANCEVSTTDQPTTTEEPSTQGPTTEEPSTHEPTTEEPSTHEPTTEEPSTHEPPTQGPTTEESTTQDPTTEEPSTTSEITTETTLEPTQEPTTETPTTPSEFQPDCPAKGTITIPNPKDCGSFYVCINGLSALIECPAGLHFNADKEICQNPSEANCQLTTPPTEPSDPTTEPTTEPSDPTTEPTTEPSDPTTKPTTEPSDPTAEPTTEPETSTEPNQPTETTTEQHSTTEETTESQTTAGPTDATTEPNEPTTRTTESTEPTTEKPSGPQCPPTGTELIPNPSDCGSFIVCIEGHSAIIQCPEGFHYNAEEQRCQTPSEAHCQLSTTTGEPTVTDTPTTEQGTTPTDEATQTTEQGTSTTEQATEEPTTTEIPTTSQEPTTTEQATEEPTTTEIPTTSQEPTTTEQATEEPTTTEIPTTSQEPTTTEQATEEPTTTEIPTTSQEPTTTEQATEEPTTTEIPTTSQEPTTTGPWVPECPPKGTITIPNPEDCGSFYVCINGLSALITCPAGKHFNAESETCQDPDDAHCEIATTSTEPATQTTTETSQESTTEPAQETTTERATETTTEPGEYVPACPSEGVTQLPNPTDCSSFYVCINGGYALINCPAGFQFNPTKQICEESSGGSCNFLLKFQKEATCHTDGELLPDPSDCSMYYICSDGTPILMPCPPGTYFSEELQRCDLPEHSTCYTSTYPPTDGTETTLTTAPSDPTEPTHTPTEPETTPSATTDPTVPTGTTPGSDVQCPSNGTVFLPNPDDCGSYFVCISGYPALIHCPVNYEYNPTTETCVPSNGTCQVGPTTQPPDHEPECPKNGTTTLPNPTDCGSYYLCINGGSALITCPNGYYYSDEKGGCDLAENTDCGQTATPTIPTDTPTMDTEETTVGSTTPTESASEATETTGPTEPTGPTEGTTPSGDIKCPPIGSGPTLLPDPEDCTKYYICDNGNPVHRECPPGLHFNPVIENCDQPEHAGCEETQSSLFAHMKEYKFNIFNRK